MSLAVQGLGTAVPPTSVNQAESLALARKVCCRGGEPADLLPGLYRQSGIQTRYMTFTPEVVRDVLEETNFTGSPFVPRNGADDPGPTTAERMEHFGREALPLGEAAGRAALDESGLPPKAITHLVTVSCTGFAAPGLDIGLMKALGLRPTVERTNVGFMGCHGALNGLRVARALTGASPQARVLLCAVELCAVHYHYRWNPKKMVANALFADGAAALVGVPVQAARTGTWQAAASGSCVFPDSEYAMTWNIGDHGFEMTLSTRVPDLIARNLRPWLEAWLDANGLALGDVGSWAVHPGGPRIITAVEEALGLDATATAVSREVLASYGNMSSPTVLFILRLLRERQAPRPCVMLAFGPGLTVEAGLFR
jgi:predicted naringenin-chalcone synthase